MCNRVNSKRAEYIGVGRGRAVKRPFLVAIGSIIGLFFALLSATGITMLLGDPYLSKPYTVTITLLSVLLAYGGFRVAGSALHTKPRAH